MEKDYIPKQEEGAQNNTVEQIELPDKQQARRQFKIARKRLLDIANWALIAHGPSSEFCLSDELGNEITRPAQVGDHIKIDLPGPGSWLGGGNDWVKIECIIEDKDIDLDEEVTVITVRPCANPLSTEPVIAHFFDDKATNTFMVMRRQNTLLAGVYGRNELPNDEHDLISKIRNKIVAISDMAGFSHPQWKHLTQGLIHIPTNFLPAPAEVLNYELKDDGIFPNSKLPVLIYKKVIELPGNDSPEIIEDIFDSNGWTNSWRNGIFDVHHYHSITHEVLGIYSGNCKMMLGGDKGEQVLLERGDVVIIPAGVAHKNLGQSADFKCVGAYPDGKDYDMNYGKADERPQTDQHILAVPIPKTDPVYGGDALLFTYWK